MKQLIIILFGCLLIGIGACKRVCYQCNQYCAYCVQASDSSVAVKLCAERASAAYRVDSFLVAYRNSGYICNLLNDQQSVCGSKNNINSGVSYYKRQDFYCDQKQ